MSNNIKNMDTWCVNADHAMSGNNTGTTKICCMYRDENLKHSLGAEPIEISFKQKAFQEVRDALGSGIRHPKCSWCFEEEDAGRKSKRQRDNDKYVDWLRKGNAPFEGLAKFELNLGNTCNLKCRTCGSHSSSTWMEEDYAVYEHNRYPTYKLFAQSMKKYHQHYDDESPFWDDLENNLSTIKQFDFYGGEPFMSKKMWRILEVAVEKGYAKDIEVHYATNGTQWPEDKVEIFKHFRHVHLSFSVDGIGEQFEYMRYPAKWSEVTENMRKAVDLSNRTGNIYLGWCITLSTINITGLPAILKEHSKNFKEFGPYLNLVHGPIQYNLTQLPADIKPYVVDILKSIPKDDVDGYMYEYHIPGIINFITNGTAKPENWEKFNRHIRDHDEYRGQNFATVYPEYARVINYE
jgi:sulfatase maturation enzyme AslB (radical SAM superfamily)